ncbi:MAG: PQQ-binding-like beta-propeller repeat protein [Prevotellaceae bacterium]|nr:PQQ-binding-like beta-propeller repeat protein [Prevotellaceae bacterium]
MKSKYLFLALFFVATLTVGCSNDDNEQKKEPAPEFSFNGAFVLNEGNFYSNIDGSLSLLDYTTGKMNNKLFSTINGKSLGATPNDMVVSGDKAYISVTDDNIVWVLDKDLKALSMINITKPRKIVAVNDKIFISSYDGRVYAYDTKSAQLTKSDVIGSYLEDITYCNGFIYVCNSYNEDYTYNTNVVKLETTLKKVSDITVVCNPTKLETDGRDVYLLSTGDYDSVGSMLQRIDTNDKVEAMFPALYFTLYNNKIYYIDTTYDADWNSVTTYNVYDIAQSKSSIFIEGKDIEYPAGIAADSSNGNIYLMVYHISEYGWGDYNNPGYIVRYDSNGNQIGKYDVGVCPTTMCFTE